MDFEKICNESKLAEQQSQLRLAETSYYDTLSDTLEVMTESERIETLSKLDEKALFNSLSAQARKMEKALRETIASLEELIGKDGKGGPVQLDAAKNNQTAAVLYQQLLTVYNEAKASLAKVTSPEFVNSYKTIDKNTNIFGKTKGSMGFSSSDINNSTGGSFTK